MAKRADLRLVVLLLALVAGAFAGERAAAPSGPSPLGDMMRPGADAASSAWVSDSAAVAPSPAQGGF